MRKWMAACAIAVGWLAPEAALAQAPVATAVLYEVNEALRFLKAPGRRPVLDSQEVARRLAHASLLGREVHPLVEHPMFKADSFIQASATSNVDLATGRGPVQGKLYLLADLDPDRESLDTLLIMHEAGIKGDLDLSTAMQGFAAIGGQWNVRPPRSPKRSGTFQGLFLIPFRVPGDERYFYLDLSGEGPGTLCASQAGICPLEGHEFSLGIPLTKLVVTFFE